MSLTDGGIQPTMNVTPGGVGGMGNMFGGDGSWFLIILFLFVFLGWGNNNGNNGGGGSVYPGYVLSSDNANLERKLDGVNNGLCDGFYQQAQLINGVNLNMNNGFMTAELSRANQQAALMQQLNAMAMQNQQCCCDQRADAAQTRYDLATQACDTRNLVQNATRDIIDAMNTGFRGIDQRLTAQELAAKDAQIRAQDQRLFMAELRASQESQTNGLRGYIDGQFAYYNPPARPAYIVQNPNCCYQQCCNG